MFLAWFQSMLQGSLDTLPLFCVVNHSGYPPLESVCFPSRALAALACFILLCGPCASHISHTTTLHCLRVKRRSPVLFCCAAKPREYPAKEGQDSENSDALLVTHLRQLMGFWQCFKMKA